MIFSVDIISNGAGITSISEPTLFIENPMQVTPNPFSDNFIVTFDLIEKTTELTLRLLNTLGQEVAVQTLGGLNKGNHTVNWKNASLKNGFYFLQLQDGNRQSVSRKILKLK